jgi:hypothetical protein
VITSGRIPKEETPWTGITAPPVNLLPKNPPPENPPLPGMIQCVLDLKSGSSSPAEKREYNKYASRRYRNRKQDNLKMERKIAALQCELELALNTLEGQAQKIERLEQERDFYREHSIIK